MMSEPRGMASGNEARTAGRLLFARAPEADDERQPIPGRWSQRVRRLAHERRVLVPRRFGCRDPIPLAA